MLAEEDFPHFTPGVEDQNVAGHRVRPPPTEPSIERQTEQHRHSQQPVNKSDPAFRAQHRVVECLSGASLPAARANITAAVTAVHAIPNSEWRG